MNVYQAKARQLPGTSYIETYHAARAIFRNLERKTRRRPYVRSAYFRKEKIFLTLFWQHLQDKRPKDRMRRLQYFAAAIELIQRSRQQP